MRSVNFLLTLAAVVAATLLATPLPAVAETEAPNPPSVTPSEVERMPVGAAGPAPSAACSATTTAAATATDIDPGCFDECQREYQRCSDAEPTWWRRPGYCLSEYSRCEERCIAGEGCDGTYPWWFCSTPSAHSVAETTAQRPVAKNAGTPATTKSPAGGVPQYDAERPTPPQPQLF